MLRWKFWSKKEPLKEDLLQKADSTDLEDWPAFVKATASLQHHFWSIRIPKPSFDALDSLLAHILKLFDHNIRLRQMSYVLTSPSKQGNGKQP